MLALVGSGEYLPPMENVDQELLSRLSGPPRVACLPTAAGAEGAERIAYWSALGVEHFSRLGAAVETVPLLTRQDAENPALAERIAGANFVYLSGGRPDYLFRTLQGTPAWQAILAVHQGGGVVAGCSAGAMILGEKLPGFPALGPAFGLLPGTLIMPHFDEIPPWLSGPLRLLAGRRLTLVGIDGDTALVAGPDGYRVLGRRAVTVFGPEGRTRYTHGQAPAW
jgi:cyanophycinase